jgi:hypothetical protein
MQTNTLHASMVKLHSGKLAGPLDIEVLLDIVLGCGMDRSACAPAAQLCKSCL